MEETASHPLLAAPVETDDHESARAFSNSAGADDVFGIGSEITLCNSALSTAGGTPHQGRRYASTGYDHRYPQGRYELSASDVSSNEGVDSPHSVSMGESANRQPESRDREANNDDDFETLHTYDGSTNSSVANSLSGATMAECQTRDAPQATTAYAEQRNARQARVRIQAPNTMPTTVMFHRPLPLRAFESEAHLFPTSRAQGASSHSRTKSAGSLVRASRPTTLVIDRTPQTTASQLVDLPVRSSSLRANTTPLRPQSEATTRRTRLSDTESSIDIDGIAGMLDSTTAGTPRASSMAETIAGFPVPPMQNPVGALPMAVPRATAAAAAANQSMNPVALLYQAVRAVAGAAATITNNIDHTRDLGDRLPAVNWSTMTAFERSWRSNNEELLIAIYGRMDVVLIDEDIEYIDLMAMELRTSPAAAWILDYFHEDGEMF